MFFAGMSHCTDITSPSGPDDPENLKNAREFLINTLSAWLSVEKALRNIL